MDNGFLAMNYTTSEYQKGQTVYFKASDGTTCEGKFEHFTNRVVQVKLEKGGMQLQEVAIACVRTATGTLNIPREMLL